jgi:hypothetical protein
MVNHAKTKDFILFKHFLDPAYFDVQANLFVKGTLTRKNVSQISTWGDALGLKHEPTTA